MSKKKLVLDDKGKAGLQALDKIFNKKQLTDIEKAAAAAFLESSIGNIELNAFLRKNNAKSLGISDNLHSNLSYISYKTRNIDFDKAEEIIKKMQRAHKSKQKGEEIREEDKVTLKEYAIISDLAKIQKSINYPDEILSLSPKLKRVNELAKKAAVINRGLTKELNVDLAQVGPGTIVFDDTTKRNSLQRTALSFMDKIVNLFSKRAHTAILHTQEGGVAHRSEIFQLNDINNYKVGIEGHLSADMYRLDFGALIPKEEHSKMVQLYGENWKGVVEAKYKLIENEIHCTETMSTRFGGLRADDTSAQRRAGLANLTPFGHKKARANDFEEIHRNVMENHYADKDNPRMLCSEFSGVATIAALVELDKQIKADMAKHPELNTPHPKSVVKIPIGKHEDLHKMHPGRLLDILLQSGCVKKVEVNTDKYFKEAETIGQKVKKYIAKKLSHKQTPPVKAKAAEKGSVSL